MDFSPVVCAGALKDQLPLPQEGALFIQRSRQTVQQILQGIDPRILLIIGPCSIHDLASAYEYASKLKELAKKLSRQFFIVMRTYLEKPRSSGGWKGFLNDPGLDGSCDIEQGLRLGRQLLIDLATLGVPTGCELLEINTAPYLMDLLSWGCIGARTSSSQPHRGLASGCPFPVGFKNSTEGDLAGALSGILVAETPHVYLGLDAAGKPARIQTAGNPHCHLVLRGSRFGTNYDRHSIAHALESAERRGMKSKLLVDCSHDNCKKEPLEQKNVFRGVLDQILEGNSAIGGMMIESHLLGGYQPLGEHLDYGRSVTDPCIGFDQLAPLLLSAGEALNSEAPKEALSEYATLFSGNGIKSTQT